MCTVTYLPINNKEFILTSNRDEDVNRPTAIPIKEYVIDNKNLFFPKDPKANGTWIAQDTKGYTLCLLNGAYQKHEVKSTYKKSRGLVLLDFYKFNCPTNFSANYDFMGIEPFTLIIVYACSNTDKILLYELKWDGHKANLIAHDSTLPQIWSSITLYTVDIIEERRNWFNKWLALNKLNTADDVLFFHHFGGNGSIENDLIINRGQKRTVSICCINKSTSYTEITYEDIINQKRYKNRIINC